VRCDAASDQTDTPRWHYCSPYLTRYRAAPCPPAFMPVSDSIPLRKTPSHRPGTLSPSNNHDLDRAPLHDARPLPLSRDASPFTEIAHPRHVKRNSVAFQEPDSPGSDITFDDWDEHDDERGNRMPSDLRSSQERERDGLSPLLGHKAADEGSDARPGLSRRSTHTFHERDPESQAHFETRKRYTYASIFLALSLVSFTVQTETAVYIQHELKWEKPYCML
jgi:hypothetical protein